MFASIFPFISDVPTQMPPLTPGTNKKMSEVLKASFASWEKEVQDRNITKGNHHIIKETYFLQQNYVQYLYHLTYLFILCVCARLLCTPANDKKSNMHYFPYLFLFRLHMIFFQHYILLCY